MCVMPFLLQSVPILAYYALLQYPAAKAAGVPADFRSLPSITVLCWQLLRQVSGDLCITTAAQAGHTFDIAAFSSCVRVCESWSAL